MFRPLAPAVQDVYICDVAHALANICRFGGHASSFYSVAQHSVLVSHECPGYELAALLHDAQEAYLGDIPRPLKRTTTFAAYRDAEAHLEAVIHRAFGVVMEPDGVVSIALADRRMLRTEQRDLMPAAAPGEDRSDVAPYQYIITPWTPDVARNAFMERFVELVLSPHAQGDGDHGVLTA